MRIEYGFELSQVDVPRFSVETEVGIGKLFTLATLVMNVLESKSGLRGHPILAVAAVEIAAQHSKCQRVGAWIKMKEGLLFGGITLKGAYVSPGDSQTPLLVEPYLADAPSALPN